jgi:hypothetical protein
METHRHLERYFRDPAQDVLSPGCSGVACANVRQALARLGFLGGGAPDFSSAYDDTLAQAVFAFQTTYGHTSRDGACGPGTRAMLVRVMSAAEHRQAFSRWPDPERRNEGSHAFVSYAHDDTLQVRPFVRLMQAWGYRVWFDENLTAGSKWSDALEQQIRDAWLVIVFLSARSAQREWVQREIGLAHRSGRRILPVPLDGAPAPPALAAVLGQHQYLSHRPVIAGEMDDATQDRLALALREAHQEHLAG